MKVPDNITPEQIEHIKALAQFVRKKEIQARDVYFKLFDKQFELLDKREIEVNNGISSFSEKLMISFDTDKDNPNDITKNDFCVSDTLVSSLFRTREDDEEPSHIAILDLEKLYSSDNIFNKNYNPDKDNKAHLFYGFHFSRGMNETLNNNQLSFENILKIDNVWIDFNMKFSLINYHDSLLEDLPYIKKK